MNDNNSISDFFYNIIPGSLFIFLVNYLYNINIVGIAGLDTQDSAGTIFAYIVFGLFFGFLFQGCTKIARHMHFNKKAFERVKNNNKTEFDRVCINIFDKHYKRDN